MSDKITISYNNGASTIFEALGIPAERFEDLSYRLECIIHDVFRPVKGDREISSDEILKRALSYCETQEEAILMAFLAGIESEKYLYSNTDLERVEEDDEDAE